MTDHSARPDGAASSPARLAEEHRLASEAYASTAHLRPRPALPDTPRNEPRELDTTAHLPLFVPGEDRAPDTQTVSLALSMARESLQRCASSNVHSHGQMLAAAVELDFALRQLVVALDAERGDVR